MATSELERISNMESHLDEIATVTNKLQEQLDVMKAAKGHAQALFQYYGSEGCVSTACACHKTAV